MIRYLGGRHGGLKYERYDGPRPHTIPFPRWCISANLRSLVLSLSFLPSSSATSSPPPSPLPLLLCPSSAPLHLSLALLVRILSPLLPLSFSLSPSLSLFVLQRTCKCRYICIYVCISQAEEKSDEEKEGEERRDLYTCIPVSYTFEPTSGHFYRHHLIATIRYLMATSYICVWVYPPSLSLCSRHGPRVLTLGISLAIVKSPTLKGITGERRTFLDPWSGINAFDAKRFFKNGERRGILRGGRSRFFVVDYIIQLLVPFATLVRFNELFGGFNVFRHQVLEICLEIVKKRKAKSLVFRLSANSISEIFIFFNFFPVLFLK